MSFFDALKNIFLLLIFVQFAPTLVEGIKKQYSHYLSPKAQVGVISLKTLNDSNEYNKQLHSFFENTEIKAILLKVDCPGGAAASSQAIHNELQALKRDYPKPVVALIENTCASGGYYVASACDHIVTPGSALIGSIGATFPNIFQVRQFIENHNVRYVPLKAGEYKVMGDPFVDLTDNEKKLLEEVLNDSYQQFAADIAKNRKLSMANLSVWGEGKIFTGQQALKLGLVDELGSAYNAIKVIKEKAIIEGEIEWVYPPQRTSVLEMLSGSSQEDTDTMFANLLTKLACYLQEKNFSLAPDQMRHTGLAIH